MCGDKFSFDAIKGFSNWKKNSAGIYQTVPRLVLRPSGLIVPMSELEKQAEYFINKYDCIASYKLIPGNGEHSVHIKDHIPDFCRFCGKDKEHDAEKFLHNAHAISELIGNKSLFLDNECETCNKDFGRRLEDQFAKYLGPARTIAQTIGKNGIPNYKSDDASFRIDFKDKTFFVQDYVESGKAILYDDHIDFHLIKQAYTPIAAFKALVFMALSIIPEEELKAFKTAIEWIREKDNEHSKYDMSTYASKVIERFVPGPKPLPIQAVVARRKFGIYNIPYAFFILEFDNFSFQIVIPCPEKDCTILNQTVKTFAFPSTYDLHKDEYRKYGYSELKIKDLSNTKRVKGEKADFSVNFSTKIDITSAIKGKSMEDISKIFGIKKIEFAERLVK